MSMIRVSRFTRLFPGRIIPATEWIPGFARA